jgi:hypothetical protein
VYPLITEAGGRFTDWRGADTAFGGDVIATNATLGDVVRPFLITPAHAASPDATLTGGTA